jgi:cell division protein FtsQ
VQTGVSPKGRVLPGMPLEMSDPDDEDFPSASGTRFGSRGDRFAEPSGPWWRPTSIVGRVFLGLGILIVLGGFTASAMALKTYLGRDSRFRISGAGNIEATGLTQVSRTEMLPVFGEDIGRNIFFVPLNERRKQLEAIPWVERATVMRLLPDQLRVTVIERQPVAFVRQGQQVGLVDADGVLLTMPPAMMAQRNYSFPVVTGIDPSQPLAMRKARMAVYERLLGELDANNQHLSEQISEIDLTDPQDARVLMPEQGMDILGHFGDDRFLERYQRYKAHIAEWRQQYPKLAAVDLRYDSQVVLEMTPGTNAVAAAIGDSPSAASQDTKSGAVPAKPSAGTAVADASAVETAANKPAPSKPVASKPDPSVREAAVTNQPTQAANQAAGRQASASQAPTTLVKRPPQKFVSVEALAAKQRAARARAAKLRAAHEKAQREKKRTTAQHAALNTNKSSSSTHAATAAVQGQ